MPRLYVENDDSLTFLPTKGSFDSVSLRETPLRMTAPKTYSNS